MAQAGRLRLGGTFENKPGFDLKDFTNGISNKGNEPIKIDVPNPRSGVNDPDPPEIDDK